MILERDSIVPLKRVEIIIDEEDFDEIQKICRSLDIRGYTYLREVGGFGSRGKRQSEEIFLHEKNILIIIACTEDQAEKLVKTISGRMKEIGGICLISDCDWVKGPTISY
ncbi:DUF190 domain-containing protein [Nitrosomonas sp. Is37]|uniref:DUF190 domain-containing protein n=1 Tax=Nitrosomonas sp. Is37 TaxID=3080535 RepID=UPI00294B02EC|nr:DUF190 domain-containing protein [Nitrosomonas sp. Is37]MDV6345473.1 DUF190 domain-containing protein [Nitrosomonas sp. Is37]